MQNFALYQKINAEDKTDDGDNGSHDIRNNYYISTDLIILFRGICPIPKSFDITSKYRCE